MDASLKFYNTKNTTKLSVINEKSENYNNINDTYKTSNKNSEKNTIFNNEIHRYGSPTNNNYNPETHNYQNNFLSNNTRNKDGTKQSLLNNNSKISEDYNSSIYNASHYKSENPFKNNQNNDKLESTHSKKNLIDLKYTQDKDNQHEKKTHNLNILDSVNNHKGKFKVNSAVLTKSKTLYDNSHLNKNYNDYKKQKEQEYLNNEENNNLKPNNENKSDNLNLIPRSNIRNPTLKNIVDRNQVLLDSPKKSAIRNSSLKLNAEQKASVDRLFRGEGDRVKVSMVERNREKLLEELKEHIKNDREEWSYEFEDSFVPEYLKSNKPILYAGEKDKVTSYQYFKTVWEATPILMKDNPDRKVDQKLKYVEEKKLPRKQIQYLTKIKNIRKPISFYKKF